MKKRRKTSPMELPVSPAGEIIAGLGDNDSRLLRSNLADLSNLDPAELEALERVWVTIKLERRRQILHWLVELAEDNFELNFDSIFKICLRDPDAEVRRKAIEGLWESEDTSLINPLINMLQQDDSEKVRVAAAVGLGKFALLAEHKKLRFCYMSGISQALLAAIEDKSKPVELRRRALEAAAPLSLPQVEKAIMEAYQSRRPELIISAVYAMGKSRDSCWLPMLLEELSNADAEMRYEAAGACGELGEEEAVPRLVELVSDPDADVRLAAIQALGKIGGDKAKEYLEQCLKNSTEAVRQAAGQSLHELSEEEGFFYFRV